jgi:hypothetical protein
VSLDKVITVPFFVSVVRKQVRLLERTKVPSSFSHFRRPHQDQGALRKSANPNSDLPLMLLSSSRIRLGCIIMVLPQIQKAGSTREIRYLWK